MSASLRFEETLDAIPTPNAAVRLEQRAHGAVLFVPIKDHFWLKALRLILPLRRERGFALDRLGEEVFKACDGEHTLESIVEGFATRHQVRFHEARLAVMQFIRALSERNLVALLFPAKEGA